ncbi:MAG: hypothetical protein JWO19_200 [Bryobacterales bacterium]|nr:hypothetical protein [Bryobacterales bacterium]
MLGQSASRIDPIIAHGSGIGSPSFFRRAVDLPRRKFTFNCCRLRQEAPFRQRNLPAVGGRNQPAMVDSSMPSFATAWQSEGVTTACEASAGSEHFITIGERIGSAALSWRRLNQGCPPGATVVREKRRATSRRCSSPSRTHYAQMEADSFATLVRLAAKFTYRAAEKL